MADMQTLIDMGFPKEKAEYAMKVTNYRGIEPAMEWLLAHADELKLEANSESPGQDEASATAATAATAITAATASTAATAITTAAPATEAATPVTASTSTSKTETETEKNADASTTSAPIAKSLKCDECHKICKDQMEMEYHADKMKHFNFSETTEEKKPLSDEEKIAQLELIEERLKLKRIEREERERADALEREKNRIKSGKDMTEARKKLEEIEMKKIIAQQKREKAEEKVARDRVRAQIEADKAARKARELQSQSTEQPTGNATSPLNAIPSNMGANASMIMSASASGIANAGAAKTYTNTRIQIRLLDGNTLTETFGVKEQLSAIRCFIQVKTGDVLPFGLMTSFPRKLFENDDYDKPLEVLGLVPSAVLIMTKPTH